MTRACGNVQQLRARPASNMLWAMYREFFDDGYIIVQQDIRERAPARKASSLWTEPIVGPLNHSGIDESTDAYDTIDWLVKNVPESNGRVGDDRFIISWLFDARLGDQSPSRASKAAAPEKSDG